MLYDTCDYHILHYSKLIIVHPITTVLIHSSLLHKRAMSCISLILSDLTFNFAICYEI